MTRNKTHNYCEEGIPFDENKHYLFGRHNGEQSNHANLIVKKLTKQSSDEYSTIKVKEKMKYRKDFLKDLKQIDIKFGIKKDDGRFYEENNDNVILQTFSLLFKYIRRKEAKKGEAKNHLHLPNITATDADYIFRILNQDDNECFNNIHSNFRERTQPPNFTEIIQQPNPDNKFGR